MKLLSLLFLLGACHGAFLVLVLFSKGRGRVKANNFLAFFLAIFSGYLFESFLVLEGLISRFPHILAVFVPYFYLLGPLYYFYIKSILDPEAKLSERDLLHAVPAFVCFLTIVPFYLQPGEYKASRIANVDPNNFRLSANRAAYYGVPLLQSIIYTYAAWRSLQQRRTSRDGRSLKNATVSKKWLSHLTIAYAIFLLFYLAVYLLFIFTDFYLYYIFYFLVLLSAVFIHFVGYWTAKESLIVSGAAALSLQHRYAGSRLSESRVGSLKEGLLQLMQVERFYRKSDVSLIEVSKRLSANSQYLSQLVNQDFQCNFSDFINSFRIEEAKKLLQQKEFSHMSLLAIGMEVGFTNKNTFIRAFKRHTGRTPSEFRKTPDVADS